MDGPDNERFFQAGDDASRSRGRRTRANTDLHLHEALVRWSGWRLSAPTVGTHPTRSDTPGKALPDLPFKRTRRSLDGYLRWTDNFFIGQGPTTIRRDDVEASVHSRGDASTRLLAGRPTSA